MDSTCPHLPYQPWNQAGQEIHKTANYTTKKFTVHFTLWFPPIHFPGFSEPKLLWLLKFLLFCLFLGDLKPLPAAAVGFAWVSGMNFCRSRRKTRFVKPGVDFFVDESGVVEGFSNLVGEAKWRWCDSQLHRNHLNYPEIYLKHAQPPNTQELHPSQVVSWYFLWVRTRNNRVVAGWKMQNDPCSDWKLHAKKESKTSQ